MKSSSSFSHQILGFSSSCCYGNIVTIITLVSITFGIIIIATTLTAAVIRPVYDYYGCYNPSKNNFHLCCI